MRAPVPPILWKKANAAHDHMGPLMFRFVTLAVTLMVMVLVLAACDGSPQEPLPTILAVPTDAPTDPAEQGDSVAVAITPVSVQTLDAAPTTEDTLVETEEPAISTTHEVGLAPTEDTSDGLTPTLTPSLTITSTITPEPTSTPVPTGVPGLLDEIIAMALEATILPQEYVDLSQLSGGSGGTPGGDTSDLPLPGGANPGGMMTPAAVTCAFTPAGGFGQIYANDPTLPAQLGCPVGAPPVNAIRTGAIQEFQFGFMMWVQAASGSGNIYAFYVNGTYKRFPDTFVEGTDPASGGETPPESNLREPVRGFGKVWRTNPDVRTALGWATAAERAASVTTLDFERGHMHYVDVRGSTLILVQTAPDQGTWRQQIGAS